MKKLVTVLLITILFFAAFTPGFATTDQATIPNFPVKFNGILIDNQHALYPLLVYKDITYFPMTWDYASALGLSTEYTNAKGLVIAKSGSSVNLVQTRTATNDMNRSYRIGRPNFPITVNGQKIDNSKEPYPLLVFRYITYFPLTWRFAVDEFGWEYEYTNQTGLRIETHPFQPTSPQHEQKTLNYGNGDKYEGEMLNGYKDGFGTYTWANGDYYTGEWQQNKKHGIGTLTRASGNSYSGDWKNDDKNGFGTFTFHYGDQYAGEVTQSKYHGIGTYTWANGNVYQGTWLHGERTGNGLITYANGDRYDGGFLDGSYEGYGKKTLKDGTVQEGIWHAGKLETTMPPAPTEVSATANEDNSISLNWTLAESANYATLYYTTDPSGKWTELKQPDGLQLKLRGHGYTFRNAFAGDVYYFKLTSTYSGIESKDSLIVSAKAGDTSGEITSHVIQTKIKHIFNGFMSERTYELTNGQVWKQTSYENENAHLFMPDVLIYLDKDEYRMLVDGSDKKPTVVRIK